MPTLKPNGQRLNGRGGGWISQTTRLAIYLRDRFRCAYCDRDLSGASPREITLDHLRPRSKGEDNRPTNLVTACVWCNSRRQDKPLAAFVPDPTRRRGIYRQAKRKLNRELARELRARTRVQKGEEG
jgi:5-methylcytosine-specific restriction endonuclease McrA